MRCTRACTEFSPARPTRQAAAASSDATPVSVSIPTKRQTSNTRELKAAVADMTGTSESSGGPREVNAPPLPLVRSPWTKTFDDLISLVYNHLLIACPFAKRAAPEPVLNQLNQRKRCESVHIDLVTNFTAESSLAGSMDLDALVEIGRSVPGFKLTHLPSVHAKVYVAD